MSEPLVEKHRPETWGDIQGNNTAIKQLRAWVNDWEDGVRGQPQLLAGPPGVGKTSTAHVISNETGWPLLEVNASDARRTDEIAHVAEQMKLTPIDAEYQLIVLDEADSIPGSTKLAPLKEVFKDPSNPLLLICNEKWEVPKPLKRECKDYDFSLSISSRRAKLKKVMKDEGLEMGAATLSQYAQRENLRDALQDLQTYGEADEVGDDTRQYGDSPFSALDDIRMGEGIDGQTDETPEDFHRWLDSGLRGQYRGVEAQVVWDLLARSAKWLSRSRNEQNYRYWKYASDLQHQIAEVRVTEPYDGYVNYGSPNYVYTPKATSDSAEATLFRELAGDDGRPGITCDFHEFRHIYLPMLTDLPAEERHQLALEHGLSDTALDALDLDAGRHDDWATDEGERIEESSVFDW